MPQSNLLSLNDACARRTLHVNRKLPRIEDVLAYQVEGGGERHSEEAGIAEQLLVADLNSVGLTQ